MQSYNSEASKLIALFFIQFIGVGSVLFTVIKLQSFTEISERIHKYMTTVVGVALGVVLLCFCSSNCFRDLLQTMLNKSGITSLFFSFTTLSKAILIFALIDLFALGFLIWATGGSRESLFTPYLLVIVPLTILLYESQGKVIFYFLLTVAIFWFCLLNKNRSFSIKSNMSKRYDKYYGMIITFCALFPTAVKVFIQ